MDQDFSDNPGDRPVPPTASVSQEPSRYDFEMPTGTSVHDLLALQLADCARIVRTLADQASDPRLQDVERLHTIHSLTSIVAASGDLAECIDRLDGGAGWRHERPQPRKRVRDS